MVCITSMNRNDSLYQNHMYNQVVSTIRCLSWHVHNSVYHEINITSDPMSIYSYYEPFIIVNYISEYQLLPVIDTSHTTPTTLIN